MPTVHLLIKGKVQGVFYRKSAKEMAEKMDVTGWVRNTENEDVEIVASGSADALKAYMEWCHTGPKRAEVTDVIITPVADESFEKFEVRRG